MINLTNNVTFLIHGGGTGEGLAGGLVSVLEFLESLSGKTPPEMFSTIMPGIAAMENMHPLFVHFPIAFFFAFFLFELLGTFLSKMQWRYLASWFLFLGTISAVFAVLAGLFAAESVAHSDDVHDIMERHEQIGITVLALASFLSVWRILQWGSEKSSGSNAIFLGLAGLLCLLVSLGADLGGLMVYGYGVSVKPDSAVTADSTVPAASVVDPKAHDHGGHHHEHGGHHHHHDN